MKTTLISLIVSVVILAAVIFAVPMLADTPACRELAFFRPWQPAVAPPPPPAVPTYNYFQRGPQTFRETPATGTIEFFAINRWVKMPPPSQR